MVKLFRFTHCCIAKWLREAMIYVLLFRLWLIAALLNGCARRRKLWTIDYRLNKTTNS